MACLASFNAFFPSLPLVISGKMGLLRCRHTSRLRAAQQNTTQHNQKQETVLDCTSLEFENTTATQHEKRTLLFESLIMSFFTYAIELWACAHHSKYLSQIIGFASGLYVMDYTSKYSAITDVIRIQDRLLWEKITNDSTHLLHELLPPQRSRSLRKRGHPYNHPLVTTEHHIRCFVNRCHFYFI